MAIDRDDHRPAHLHVVRDGEAEIDLVGGDGTPKLPSADRFERSQVRRAVDVVTDETDDLLRG